MQLKSRHWKCFVQLREDPADTEEEISVFDPDVCEHGSTICMECASSWGIDWKLRWVRLNPETGEPIEKGEVVSTPKPPADPEPMTDEQGAAMDAAYGNPDGWMCEHHRASGSSSCRFGPFASFKEAHDWWREVGYQQGVRPSLVPLYKTVDWTR